jgi:predicted ArsR family transcriptional regulator
MLGNHATTDGGRTPAAEGTAVPERPESLVSLLGDQRASLVTYLRRAGEAGVGELADHLGITDVATRRHLGVLVDEDLVATRDVADGPGRPARRYRLTDRAVGLFPQRSAAVADELLQFLEDTQGREGLRAYLRWRLERQTAQLEQRVTAEDLPQRLGQLAEALSDAGFDATVDVAGDRFVLRQDHCAIYDVAREHPEMCAYEAATFSRVLGRDVRLSRQQTRADGGTACVCCVSPRSADAPPPERCLPVVTEHATTGD